MWCWTNVNKVYSSKKIISTLDGPNNKEFIDYYFLLLLLFIIKWIDQNWGYKKSEPIENVGGNCDRLEWSAKQKTE